MTQPIVYCYHCLATGKKYIGATKNAYRRHNQHRSNVRNGRYPHLPFYSAVRKYGWDNFIYGVIAECDHSKLEEIEDYYISQYNTIAEGYNVRNSGGGYNTTGTYYRRPSVKRGPHSELHKQRISEASKGRIITQDIRDRISETLSNNHPRSRQWTLTFDNGRVTQVFNLKRWCREQGYEQSILSRMYKLGKGTHKNIIKITSP